jgi:hypothetical protein
VGQKKEGRHSSAWRQHRFCRAKLYTYIEAVPFYILETNSAYPWIDKADLSCGRWSALAQQLIDSNDRLMTRGAPADA